MLRWSLGGKGLANCARGVNQVTCTDWSLWKEHTLAIPTSLLACKMHGAVLYFIRLHKLPPTCNDIHICKSCVERSRPLP